MIVKGLVSIITPTYNCRKFIAATIQSVIDQTYSNWEMIIVDDCSQDETGIIVHKYMALDKRIQYLRLLKNSGPAIARNKAMEIAKGQYMAFLDSDDLWYKEKLEKQIKWMQFHNYPFTCTSYEQIDESGNKLNKIIHSLKRTDYNRLLLDCPVGNSTVIYNRDHMGNFKVPNIRKRNDDALWLQMLKKEHYIYGFPNVLMEYRVRRNSISSNKFKLIAYHWYLYRKIEHLTICCSVAHILYWCVIKVLKIK